MDHQSINKYLGSLVKITLVNNFWYRAKIISVSEKTIEFIEEKGRRLSVSPAAVLMIEEVFSK